MSKTFWTPLSRHLAHLDTGQWGPMQDSDGIVLPGIEGRQGVWGMRRDKTFFGGDFIRMQPGSKFPLHTHKGDHIIYFIKGEGFVRIEGVDCAVTGGHMVHIPAKYPHGVWVSKHATMPLVFVAVGHPHHPVYTRDRMKLVK